MHNRNGSGCQWIRTFFQGQAQYTFKVSSYRNVPVSLLLVRGKSHAEEVKKTLRTIPSCNQLAEILSCVRGCCPEVIKVATLV